MVKPSLPYLDIISDCVAVAPDHPVACYQVSGEYAMVCAGAEKGIYDLKEMAFETTESFLRAGMFTPQKRSGLKLIWKELPLFSATSHPSSSTGWTRTSRVVVKHKRSIASSRPLSQQKVGLDLRHSLHAQPQRRPSAAFLSLRISEI
jgi:hypothetical protein